MIHIYRAFFVLTLFFISYGVFVPFESSQSIYLDKVVHFLAFLILTFLLDISLRDPINFQRYAILFLIAYAGCIEFIQYFLPYRSAEIFDFLSDLLGILVYLYFAPKIYIRFRG
jgi:VanZ family protein